MTVFRLVEKYGLVPRFVLEQPSERSVESDFDVIKSALRRVALNEVSASKLQGREVGLTFI